MCRASKHASLESADKLIAMKNWNGLDILKNIGIG